jgi:hypothetical protein
MFEHQSQGLKGDEIAQAMGVSHKRVRNSMSEGRSTARLVWATYLAAAIFIAVALLLWIVRRDPNVAGGKGSHPHASPAPTEVVPVPPAP